MRLLPGQRLRAEIWRIRLRSSVAEGEVTTTSLDGSSHGSGSGSPKPIITGSSPQIWYSRNSKLDLTASGETLARLAIPLMCGAERRSDRELPDCVDNAQPNRHAPKIAIVREFLGSFGAFRRGLVAVAYEQQVGYPPDGAIRSHLGGIFVGCLLTVNTCGVMASGAPARRPAASAHPPAPGTPMASGL